MRLILISVIKKESFAIACLEVLDSVSHTVSVVGLSSSSQKAIIALQSCLDHFM
mgnify:CR=1 FL=1